MPETIARGASEDLYTIPHEVFRIAEPAAPPPTRPRLLTLVRRAIRARQYSHRTEEAYTGWIKRFIIFHDKRHPLAMGPDEIRAFLSYLATERRVSDSTQTQALCALLFLYREVLRKDLGRVEEIPRAKKSVRLPTVLSRKEVGRILDCLSGKHRLIASLLYGSGLRLMECLQLRVKDVDFERRQIHVRRGKGGKDRATVLPAALLDPLRSQIERASDVAGIKDGVADVAATMPTALDRKMPAAGLEWAWQYVFPASRVAVDKATGS